MPYTVVHQGSRWIVYKKGADGEPTGTALGTHPTKEEAINQIGAIESEERRRSGKSGEGLDVFLGDAIKSLGGRRIGGYLVHFSTAADPDGSPLRDFFTPETDFGVDEWPAKVPVIFHHGRIPEIGRRRIGTATLEMTDKGLLAEAILKEHDEWADFVLTELLPHKSKLGGSILHWSSGALGHTVAREPVLSAGGEVIAHEVKSWWIGEASLTHTPAEYRCQAVRQAFDVKSLAVPSLGEILESARLASRPGLVEQVRQALQAIEACNDRLDDRATFREETKAGRVFSSAVLEEMERLDRSLGDAQERLRALRARGERQGETTGVVITTGPGRTDASVAEAVTTEAMTAMPMTAMPMTALPEQANQSPAALVSGAMPIFTHADLARGIDELSAASARAYQASLRAP